MITFKYNILLVFDTRQIGAKKFIPLDIRSLNKRMNFFSSTYSIWTTEVLIDSAKALLLEQTQLNTVVRLKITRTAIDRENRSNENGVTTDETSEYTDTIVDEEFMPMYDITSFTTNNTDLEDEALPESDMDILDNIAETTGIIEQTDEPKNTDNMFNGETTAETRIIRMTLHPMDFRATSKIFINKIIGQEKFEKVKVGDALMNLVFAKIAQGYSKPLSDIVDEIIIDKLDNEIEYDDIKILPNDIIRSIKSLQIRYGMYKHGLIIYYDNKSFYILRKYAIEHEVNEIDAKLNLGNTHIYFGSPESQIESASGTLCIKKRKLFETYLELRENNTSPNLNLPVNYITSENAIEFDNGAFTGESVGDFYLYSNAFMGTRSISYIKGGDNTAVDWEPPVSQLQRNVKTHEESGIKFNTFYDDLNNPFNASSTLIQNEINKLCLLELDNFDFHSLKPNKFLTLHAYTKINQKKFNGKHILCSADIDFRNTDPSDPDIANDWVATTKLSTIHTRFVENFDTGDLDFTKDFERTFDGGLFGILRNKRRVDYDADMFVDPNTPGFAGVVIEEQPNEPPPDDAIVIDLSSKKLYHTQRDNMYIPHSSCNLTSCAMAFRYSGLPLDFPDLKTSDSGEKEQLEDYFLRKMTESENVKGYMRANFPRYRIIDAGQINAARELICNDLYAEHYPQYYSNKKALYTVNPTFEEVIFELVNGRAVVARVRVPYHGSNGALPHVVCLCGVITKQQNIKRVSSASEIDLRKVWKFIIDDPYGDPTNGYRVTQGNGIRISKKLLSQWAPYVNGDGVTLAFYEFVNPPR